MVELTRETCWGMVRHRRREAAVPLIVAAVLGTVIALGFWAFVTITKPVVPTLAPGDDAVVITPLPTGGAIVRLHYLSRHSPRCARQWTEIMQLGDNSFFTLATGMSGQGLGTGSEDYFVYRYLPPGLQPGTWKLQLRVRHECEPLGLVHWVSRDPVVDIPVQ